MTSGNGEGKGKRQRNKMFYFASIQTAKGTLEYLLIPAPISYTKYSSPVVSLALISVIECQEQINPTVFLSAGESDFKEVGK